MSVSNFAARTRLHPLGGREDRTVMVRESLSYMHLMSKMQRDDEDALAEMFAAWTSGEGGDPSQASVALRLNDVLIQEFVVEPRVLIPDVDEPGSGVYGEAWCWINDFTDAELQELTDLAAQGVGQVHGFPGGATVDVDSPDSEVLGDDAKPASGAKKRKR